MPARCAVTEPPGEACTCACTCHVDHSRDALAAELTYLTISERRIVNALFAELGEWVESSAVASEVYGLDGPDERHALIVHLSRIRQKLREHGAPWRIDTLPTGGALRLSSSEPLSLSDRPPRGVHAPRARHE